MTKRKSFSFRPSKEHAEQIEKYIAKFPDKSRSDILLELVLNALSLNSHLSSSDRPSLLPKLPSEEEQGLPQETQSVYEYPACPYRTLLKDGNVLCAETKKIPLEACITRQKRYLHFERSCKPIGMERKRRPRKYQTEDYSQWHDATKPFRGDVL